MGCDPRKILYLKALAEAAIGQGDLAKMRLLGTPAEQCQYRFKAVPADPFRRNLNGSTVQSGRGTVRQPGAVRIPARFGYLFHMTGRTVKPEKPWALRLLPPFPTVANRLIALVSREDVSAKEVGEVIKLDPTFTAELLRVANSALFSVSREVTGVSHAVLLLGLERVKAMAMIVALNGMVRSAVRAEPLRRFWIHSLVTAMLTEEGARAGGMAAETAYTAGLLHNLGTLGLMSAYPEEYNRMLDVSVEYGFDLIEAERDLFDIDHCAAGAYLAREWNFPEVIVRIAFGHHEDPACGEDTLEKLVRVCWRLADALGYVAFPPQQPWGYDELLGYLGGGADSWIGAGPEQAKEEIENRLRAFR